MQTLYTLGEWTAKEERQEEFVAAWEELRAVNGDWRELW